jgi:hypothetical protein
MIPSCACVAMTNAAAGGGGGGGGGGSGSPTVSLSNMSISAFATNATATATYLVQSDGTADQQINGGASSVLENWISDPSQAGSYEVQAILASGTAPTGTFGSYQILTADRSWSLANGLKNNSTKSCALTVTIRKTGTTTVLATATITLSAESDSLA